LRVDEVQDVVDLVRQRFRP